MLTDSDWSCGVFSLRLCSGGWVELEGHLLCHRGKLEANIALSSGEAELNAAATGIFEGIGEAELYRELSGVQPQLEICVDASA